MHIELAPARLLLRRRAALFGLFLHSCKVLVRSARVATALDVARRRRLELERLRPRLEICKSVLLLFLGELSLAHDKTLALGTHKLAEFCGDRLGWRTGLFARICPRLVLGCWLRLVHLGSTHHSAVLVLFVQARVVNEAALFSNVSVRAALGEYLLRKPLRLTFTLLKVVTGLVQLSRVHALFVVAAHAKLRLIRGELVPRTRGRILERTAHHRRRRVILPALQRAATLDPTRTADLRISAKAARARARHACCEFLCSTETHIRCINLTYIGTRKRHTRNQRTKRHLAALISS